MGTIRVSTSPIQIRIEQKSTVRRTSARASGARSWNRVMTSVSPDSPGLTMTHSTQWGGGRSSRPVAGGTLGGVGTPDPSGDSIQQHAAAPDSQEQLMLHLVPSIPDALNDNRVAGIMSAMMRTMTPGNFIRIDRIKCVESRLGGAGSKSIVQYRVVPAAVGSTH